ncbi:MAG: hypothetical protein HOQ43_10680 [Glycomyces artemisiae]|uniref:Uncharacterized protein n=1 Tax=Glycomyces artemisiae TaxID=1076443 RepID=A0A850C3L1_9ACTN|nr:hypothetical protein [Glycomyces artemisiae]
MPDAELDRIRADVAARVSRDVYDAHREALAYQLADLRRDHDDLKTSLAEANRSRQGMRQWVIASIVIPLLLTLVNVALVLLT